MPAEPWGLVVNEAMACGKPAIVSDQVGCAADLVAPGETGEVFPFDDWRALADAMMRFARDPASLGVMGQVARERISAYSPLAAAEGIRAAVYWVSENSMKLST